MSRLYIGNLPMDMKEKDLEDIFYKFGKITDMQLKMPERPPAFGFVTFEDSRDAEEAVKARCARQRQVYVASKAVADTVVQGLACRLL